MNLRQCLVRSALILGILLSTAAHAALTVTPITWNIIGLDSNRPDSGPRHFPVGARVCTNVATTNVSVNLVWESTNANINLRSGTASSLAIPSLATGACSDAYFEAEVTQVAAAFDTARRYYISATDGSGVATTPRPRELYVEHLVSQSRNSITGVKLDGVVVLPGGSMNLQVGKTYTIELTGSTAPSGYEEFVAYINFPNTIFQILSVATTYSADDSAYVPGPPGTVQDKLWADACLWESDPTSPNYRSCVGAAGLTGKAGGSTVVTNYTIKILGGAGTSQALTTLLFDYSGSSFHYNSDFSSGARIANIVDSNLTVGKTASVVSAPQNGTYTYSIVVSNSGQVASGAPTTITDTVPAGLSIVGLTNGSGWVCTPTTVSGPGSITCSSATGVAAGVTNQTVVTLNAIKTRTSTVVNTATVTGGDAGCAASSAPARCTSTATVTDSSQPNLTINKIASVATAASGASFTYTVQASNSGPVASSNPTTVVDTIPTGVTVTAITNGAGFTCTPSSALPLVGNGSSSQVSCVATTGVAAGAVNAPVLTLTVTKTGTNSVTNTATTTTGDPACPATARCTGTTTVPDASQPNLTINKIASVATAASGASFTYTVRVSNTGTGPSAAGTVITDSVPSGLNITGLTVGAGWACTPTTLTGPGTISCTSAAGVLAGASNETVVTLNATKTIAGSVSNVATVTSGDPACPATARCTSTSTVAGIPDLQPNFTFSFTSYVANDSRDVIININEINNVTTSGLVRFFVPFSTGFTYAFDPLRTTATMFNPNDTAGMQNGNWTVTTQATGFLFASTTPIPANGRSRIVITSRGDVAGTKANITVNIVALSGGETRTNNNAVVLAQSVQR